MSERASPPTRRRALAAPRPLPQRGLGPPCPRSQGTGKGCPSGGRPRAQQRTHPPGPAAKVRLPEAVPRSGAALLLVRRRSPAEIDSRDGCPARARGRGRHGVGGTERPQILPPQWFFHPAPAGGCFPAESLSPGRESRGLVEDVFKTAETLVCCGGYPPARAAYKPPGQCLW